MCYSSLPGGDLIAPEATIYPLVLMDVSSQGSNLTGVTIHRLPTAKGSSVDGFSINLNVLPRVRSLQLLELSFGCMHAPLYCCFLG